MGGDPCGRIWTVLDAFVAKRGVDPCGRLWTVLGAFVAKRGGTLAVAFGLSWTPLLQRDPTSVGERDRSPAWQLAATGELLQRLAIAIRITKVHKRTPGLHVELADVSASFDQLLADGFYVRDHHLKPFERARHLPETDDYLPFR